MVLTYLGKNVTEEQLTLAFETAPNWGTLPERVETALTEREYNVRWFESATLERLEQLNANQFPVIVFLSAADLPHGTSGLHAVVVVDVDDSQISCLDPAIDTDLTFTPVNFMRIWSRLGYQGMVIWR